MGHAELAQHLGRCDVARIAGRIDPVQSYQPEPSAEKFPADGCAHASTPRPRMDETGDLALTVGQATNLQLADTDEFTVEAGRIHESRPRGLQPGIHRALDEVPRLFLGVRPPRLVAASLRQAGEGMYSVAVTDNKLAHSHRGFHHEPILPGQHRHKPALKSRGSHTIKIASYSCGYSLGGTEEVDPALPSRHVGSPPLPP